MTIRVKPSRQARRDKKDQTQKELKAHRQAQYRLAIERDTGLCVFCWFLHDHKQTSGQDVHHVYSRGRDKDDYREQYRVMMCTCRECHPQPIKGGPGTSTKLAFVEGVLRQANETPINKHFKHKEE